MFVKPLLLAASLNLDCHKFTTRHERTYGLEKHLHLADIKMRDDLSDTSRPNLLQGLAHVVVPDLTHYHVHPVTHRFPDDRL